MKMADCVDCHGTFPKRDLNRNSRCIKCGWQAMIDDINQLRQKSGPHYDKWAKAVKAAADKL